MRVVSHKKLKDFYETKGCEDSRVALERWYDIAEKAEWKNLSDIKVDFPAPLAPNSRHTSPRLAQKPVPFKISRFP